MHCTSHCLLIISVFWETYKHPPVFTQCSWLSWCQGVTQISRREEITYPHSLLIRESGKSRGNNCRGSFPLSKYYFFIQKGSCKCCSTRGPLHSSIFHRQRWAPRRGPARGDPGFLCESSVDQQIFTDHTLRPRCWAWWWGHRWGQSWVLPSRLWQSSRRPKMCLTHHSNRRWKGKMPPESAGELLWVLRGRVTSGALTFQPILPVCLLASMKLVCGALCLAARVAWK